MGDKSVIRVEGWWDLTTNLPTSPPSIGDTYTVYGLYLGKRQSSTATSVK